MAGNRFILETGKSNQKNRRFPCRNREEPEMQKVLLLCFTAVFLTGCSAFSHMLAKPVVSGGKGIWKYESTTIYGSVSSFRVRDIQDARFSVSNFLEGGYKVGYELGECPCPKLGTLKIAIKRKGELMFCVEGVPVKQEFGVGFVPVNIFGYNPNIARNENIRSYYFHGIDFRGDYPKAYFRPDETYEFHYLYKPKEENPCRCEIAPIMLHADHFGGAVDDAKKDDVYKKGECSFD